MKWLVKYFWTIAIVALAVLAAGTATAVLLMRDRQAGQQAINSFAECAAAGNPIMESYPEQCRANGKTFVNTEVKPAQPLTDTVTSGKNAFSVEVPRGWGPIINAADGDQLMLNGETQPTTNVSKAVEVTKTDAYGHDGPVIFVIGAYDAVDMSLPQGTASEFSIGKGDDKITGTKYAYTYPEDTAEGIGSRLAGDRDYQYRLSLKSGKMLVASYHVYGSDPRNLIEQFETMLGSLREM